MSLERDRTCIIEQDFCRKLANIPHKDIYLAVDLGGYGDGLERQKQHDKSFLFR